MAAPPAPIDFVVPETPPCSQAAAQTPLTLQALPNRFAQPDDSPVRLPALGDASCFGDTLRIDDDGAADGCSSEGEDIMLSGKLRKDYKSIPHLDSYSTLAVDDSASLPALTEQQVCSHTTACCPMHAPYPPVHYCFLTHWFQRRSAEAEMARRDRIAQFRQRAVGSDLPRAIAAGVDERDIIEMMERRGMAEAAVVAADGIDSEQKTDATGSGSIDDVSAAGETPGVEASAAGAVAVAGAVADDVAASDGGSGSSEASMSGSEEEDGEGSWSGEEDEEGGDSDIEEFYLKGGEGQMDEVEKKKKAAAEQKIVMVHALTHVLEFSLLYPATSSTQAHVLTQVQLEKERQMKKTFITLPCAAPVKPRCTATQLKHPFTSTRLSLTAVPPLLSLPPLPIVQPLSSPGPN
jgi:hypothetical protein